ncbi:hypothetical protein Tco_0663424 [Tanacetum coccineum]
MAKENVPAPTRTDEQLNTKFFSAFTAPADVPSIYIQQFWNTLGKDSKTGVYSFQLDELWFNLNANLLRKALGITRKDSANPFVPTPAGDLERPLVVTNPKYPILQMLWRVVTGTNVDYAKLIWEEFVQAIKNFFSDVANLKVPTKKPKPHSPVHITADDYPLGNLKFVSKGGVDEVFGMPIPKDLITDAIRNSEYYKKYLEMAARKPCQPTTVIDEEGEEEESSKSWSDHLVEEEDKEGNGKGIIFDEQAAQSLIDLQKPKKQSIKDQYIFQRWTLVTQDASTRPSAQPQDDTSVNVVKDTLSPANSTNDAKTDADMEQSTSKADTEILYVEEEHGEEVSNMVALEEKVVKLDEGQTRSDPGKTPESRPPPEREHMEEDQAGSDLGQSHVAQARPNPKPMHKDFIAIVYPKVHESLKLTAEEHVHIENPPSSTRTLSLMKNL